MTKLSLKINRKYKKFSRNQRCCLVPVIGLTGLLIRQPKRFRALLSGFFCNFFFFFWCFMSAVSSPLPSRQGPGQGGHWLIGSWGLVGCLGSIIKSRAELRAGMLGVFMAAAPLPCQAINKLYRSMPGLILIEGYKDHAAPRVISPPSFLIPFKF